MRIDNRAGRIKSLLLLLTVLIIFPLIASYMDNIFTNKYESDYDPQQVKTAILGDDPWWDSDWPYRILINVTNQKSVDLTNYGVSVVFPYESINNDPNYEVNDTLKDIRIIEHDGSTNPYERKFYIFKDFSSLTNDESSGVASIYFNTNVSAGSTPPDTDTYVYFGNMDVESTAVENGLGLIKNGLFEYVPSGDDPVGNPAVSLYSYDPVGWNWSFNVPDNIIPWGDVGGEDAEHQLPTIPTTNWQNALIDTQTGHVLREDTYTYKWGTNQTTIATYPDYSLPVDDDDYNGVLFSNPFVVPIVGSGGPSDKIYLHLWRNIRVRNFDKKSDKIDGYFLRIINASAGISDLDNEVMLGNYLELFIGPSNNGINNDLRNFTDGTLQGTINTADLTLSGSLVFDISNYMGENISVEIGMVGNEGSGTDTEMAFGQIDNVLLDVDADVIVNADVVVDLNVDIQSQQSQIIIIARDVDGNIAPSAEVSLVQDGSVVDTQTTDDTGECTFSNINFGIYNFTVNYTFAPGVEQVVFNSTEANFGTSLWNTYNASNLAESFDLYLDVWTIDFEIVDWDDEPLNDGYVKIFDDQGGILLRQLSLVNGTARFRWNVSSFYYYEVYFYNTDYNSNFNDFLLNSSYIYRSNYVQNEKYYDHLLPLATYDQNPGGDYYRVYERIYTNGSLTNFSMKKLIDFNITLESMDDQIDNMTIYYIDKNNETVGNEIYQNNSMSGTDFFKSIDIRSIDNDKLKSENYEAYGILIDVQGYRVGIHNGLIKINTSELTSIYNKTALSTLNIRVIDDNDFYLPVEFVSVRIWNGTNTNPNNIITTLTTNADGWASRDDENYKPFIFLVNNDYNITLRSAGTEVPFKLNNTTPKQWEPTGDVVIYNYSLSQNSSVILDYQIPPVPAETQFEMISDISDVIWGSGNIEMTLNLTYTIDGGINWNLVLDEGTFTCTIEDWETGLTVLTLDLIANLNGSGVIQNYTITLNSTKLSAGNNFKKYWFIIDGTVSGYEPPDSYYQQVRVNATATLLDLYDYETLLPISEYDKEFGELINITVKYYTAPDTPLEDATISINWISQPTKYFTVDPMNNSFYYCTINTTLATLVGKYPITLIASKTNYTSQTIVSFLEIFERPTEVNGSDTVIFLNEKVYALETETMEFNYTDVLSLTRISNPDEISYNWQKLDEFGDPIPGESKIGTLTETGDHRYILDLDTASMELGDYFVFLTFRKINYELRNVVLSLAIEDRITSVNGSLGPFIINLYETLNFTYSYTDNLTSTSITNLDTQSYNYSGTESDSGSLAYDPTNEVYYINGGFSTVNLQSGNYTFTITLDKENYTSQVVVVSLVITFIAADYLTNLTLMSQNPSNFLTDIYWRDNVTMSFNFTTKYQSDPQELAHPTTIFLQFLDDSFIAVGSAIDLIPYNISMGNYSYTFNTSQFTLIGGESYYINILASKTGWTPPAPLLIPFNVLSVSTDLNIHNYTTGTELPSYTLAEYWNQTIGLTIYFRESISSDPITNAAVTFSWAHGSGQLSPDGLNGPGYYSFSFETGNATEVGTYTITILAVKQNFSNGVPSPSLIITIINRPTLLRPTGILTNYSVIFISEKIYALETEYFEFNYTDVFTSNIIQNADVASYNWQKLDEFGDPIPGENRIGTLNETGDRYILDLGTALMDVGEYFILITLDKLNYESRSSVFSLTIEDRITTINGSLGPSIINWGVTLNFTYSFIDNLTSTSITNLDTQSYNYSGTASGAGSLGYDSNNEIYYINGVFNTASLPFGNYTFTVTFEKQNYTSQVVTFSLVINFVPLDYHSFLTLMSQNPSNLLTDIYWRDNITISFNFTTQYQAGPKNLTHPTTIFLQFLDESLSAIGSSINLINYNTSMGIFSYTFNTSQFLFIGGESYYISILASKTAYTPPTPLQIFFKVQSVLTDLTIHNYTTGTKFPSYTLTEYWNQTFGISFYFGELISSAPIASAEVTYSWAFGSGQINPDGIKGQGYYSFFFDTGNVTEIGTYIISISAVKQNFSVGIPNPNLLISIINRPTLLNSNDDVLYLRRKFFELDSFNFTFEFTDVLTLEIIKNADEKSFILHKREPNGDPIPGSTITGSLHETADHQYILDFDSETIQEGEYSIVVTLNKDNYNIRVAVISLTVNKREFSFLISVDTRINLASGGNIQFQITLTDANNLTDPNNPIIGADLTFTIKGTVYNTITGGIIDNNDGTYTVTTSPIAEPFIMSETYIATLIIGKGNFTSETRDFTVVIQMAEIFPGMPTFYFILITAAIIGVLGSVTAYRVIQQARIPKHVKKIRKIKKLIKSKKKITEDISIPTKTEMIAKLFAKDWKEINLSIEETLGIKELKKKLPTKDLKDKGQRISKVKVPKEKTEVKSIREKERLIKKEAELKVKKEKAEENAKIKAEQKAKREDEKLVKKEAELKAKREKDEENAKIKAEQKAKREEERLAKEEAELKAEKEKKVKLPKEKATLEKIPEEKVPEEKIPEDEIPKDKTKEERGENE